MSKLREIEETMMRHDDPVVSVPELADEMDRSTTHIRDQLRLLEREGVVHSKDVGARAVAWWHEERVCPPRLPAEEHPDQSDFESIEAPEEAHSADIEMPSPDEITASLQRQYETIESVAEGWEEDRRADRKRAAQAAVKYIREHDGASAKELQENVEPEHPVDGQNARTWYRRNVKPVLSEIDAAQYSNATKEWTVETDE